MIKDLQKLMGTLNFLCRAIFAGQAFLRRMYNAQMVTDPKTGKNLKSYHHIRVTADLRADCSMWISFLQMHPVSTVLCRPFVDLNMLKTSRTLNFYTDSSANRELGFGCIFNDHWMFAKWENGFVNKFKPSIEYLELVALCIAVTTWGHSLKDCRIAIFCDKQAVMHMVNNSTSRCKNCMVLVRLLVKDGLIHNRRVYVQYVTSKDNYLSDCLSRMKIRQFKEAAPWMCNKPDKINSEAWPLSRI